MTVYRSVRGKGDTKTRKSRRVLKLPTRAVYALRAHRTRQAAERLAAREMWREHDLVFCREDGTPLDLQECPNGVAVSRGGVCIRWLPFLAPVAPSGESFPCVVRQRVGVWPGSLLAG